MCKRRDPKSYAVGRSPERLNSRIPNHASECATRSVLDSCTPGGTYAEGKMSAMNCEKVSARQTYDNSMTYV